MASMHALKYTKPNANRNAENELLKICALVPH